MKKHLPVLMALAALLALGFQVHDAQAVGAVAGRVIDADGNAVAGAQVSLMGMMMHRGERPYHAQTVSSDDGTFGFRAVPAGQYVVAAMTRELGGARAQIRVADDQVTQVELQLQGRGGGGGGGGGGGEVQVGTVTGTVLDREGNAVEGARVMAAPLVMRRGEGHRQMHPFFARTDADGHFTFENVPVGQWMIIAGARGLGMDRERADVVADQVTEVELQLQIPAGGGRPGRGG